MGQAWLTRIFLSCRKGKGDEVGILFYLGVAVFVVYFLAGLDLARGSRSLRSLARVRPSLPPRPPKVTLVVAARNEERNIAEALGSLLRLDYPDYELLVVNDRSEDATGAILGELSANQPRLRVIQVSELPAGWLGKNHALWVGARAAAGELLLFSDADIVMEPTVLSRAVTFLLQEGVDHLAVTPVLRMPGLFLDMFGASFILFFCMFARPWKARDPGSRWHIGIGAFNLVRTSAYWKVGGHQRIALRPDDDMKLGKILKLGGFRQESAYGGGLLTVEWYATLGELVRGLEKNAFAGVDYRLLLVILGSLSHLAASVWPYLAIFLTTGATRAVYIAVVALITLIFVDTVSFHGSKRWYAIAFPCTALLFVYILLRTALLNLVHGGITWRGTFYALKELKANKV
jgi:cellulose synthase/poly-beta-1,6-N-acetylglucosamine synthase-like glycosyltransferase